MADYVCVASCVWRTLAEGEEDEGIGWDLFASVCRANSKNERVCCFRPEGPTQSVTAVIRKHAAPELLLLHQVDAPSDPCVCVSDGLAHAINEPRSKAPTTIGPESERGGRSKKVV